MKIEYMAPGLGLAMIGFVLFFVLLGSVGALAKSKQLSALAFMASGKAGGGKRVLLFLAFGLMFFGACGTFAGVARSDGDRARACTQTCAARGYETGRIGKPTQFADPKHPKPACICEKANRVPLEISVDELSF
jgi:hypothetical protein